MPRPRVWSGAIAAAALAVVFAAWLPGYRYERELAAARREGLPTDARDVYRALPKVAEEANAAPLVRAAIAADKAVSRDLASAIGKVARGSGSPAQRALCRKAFADEPGLLARWRVAAFRPRVDFRRSWKDGFAVPFPEFAGIKAGAQRLVAAARLGIDPESNLQGAARLAALVRQEPTTIGPLVSVAIGRAALDAAPDAATRKRVEAALGPPIDARWTLLAEPSATLAILREVDTPSIGLPEGNLWAGLRRIGPLKTNAAWRVLHRYRALWRELPKDGTEYEAVAAALDRHTPGIYQALDDYSTGIGALLSDPEDEGRTVRMFAAFEERRRWVREGQGGPTRPASGAPSPPGQARTPPPGPTAPPPRPR